MMEVKSYVYAPTFNCGWKETNVSIFEIDESDFYNMLTETYGDYCYGGDIWNCITYDDNGNFKIAVFRKGGTEEYVYEALLI